MPSPLESIRIVARRISPLNIPFVFVGGSVMPLLVDRPDITDLRPTLDIDVVVSVLTYLQYCEMERLLRDAGFRHDLSEGAPMCRWIVEDCRVDIMPRNSLG